MDKFDDFAVRGPSVKITALGPIYKICKYKYSSFSSLHRDNSKFQKYDSKLDSSLSRTRRLILEQALCNHWDWFCTFTIDASKFDRYSLRAFYKSFSAFLKNVSQRVAPIKYILVPELHQDGAWHMHGLLAGDPGLVSFKQFRYMGNKVPNKLVNAGFYTWPAFQRKYGFCSMGRIHSHVRSAFYVSKYITKDKSGLVSQLGCKSYFNSHGLNVGVNHSTIYSPTSRYDRFIQRDYDFVKIGYTRLSDRLDWTFGLDLDEIPPEYFISCDEAEDFTGDFFDDMCSLNCEQLTFY